MPSHLTRVVFRSIIANKPLLYRGCLHRAPRPQLVLQNGLPQRRAFFNFLKPERKTKPPELPPGLEKLTELAHMQRIAARPPPPEDVAKAFNVFFSQKEKRYEDFHIIMAQNAFKYLQENPRDDKAPWISASQILKIFKSLEKAPDTGGAPHLAFARVLNEELGKRREVEESPETQPSVSKESDQPLFTSILCLYGASREARDLAEVSWNPQRSSPCPPMGLVAAVWTNILGGFCREGNNDELLRTAELMQELSIPFVHAMQDLLVDFFGRKGDLAQAKHWYSQPVVSLEDAQDTEPHSDAYAGILKACALSGDLSFGQQVVASLLKKLPNKAAWDAIFVWSAAIGKGVDEVDRMMGVMVRRNDEARQKDVSLPVVRPDVDTVNALVEFSMSKRDSYSAERYIALGEKRGILPNAKTYTMQMQYRLTAKDIDGARAAYFGFQGAKDEKSVLVINKLIRAMCEAKQHHFDDIMSIVDDLHESKARFEPETVATLCAFHLRRGEIADATDLIQVHAHHFSPPQRIIIREYLVDFLLDGHNSTADAWDTYQMLRQLFPETPRDIRVRIMNEFFARERSDMACHVFFHMRNHTHESIHADRDVYVAAFAGFARNKDSESLELVHNQLKLDLSVDLDTKLRNSLMLAYSATGASGRALEYWTEIVASKEGPTYSSIAIAFRACEDMPFGDRHAKPIWRRLRQMGMDIDKQIFTAYLGAIAHNHLHDEAVALVETAEEEYGLMPDVFMLSNWFNTTTNNEKQAKVEAWIKEHYPTVWPEIENLGHWVTMDGFGYRQYNIDRSLEP